VELFARLSRTESASALRETVRRIEGSGCVGATVGDHVVASDRSRPDPFILLAGVGMLSDRLQLSTSFLNVSLRAPVLAIRAFIDLAIMFGGDRIVAGFGCGWDGDEMRRLALPLAPHAVRVRLLSETLKLATTLFHSGRAPYDCPLLSPEVRFNPLDPPPLLAVGGASPHVLAVAAELADVVDLNARLHRHAGETWRSADQRARAQLRLTELRTAAASVRRAASAAGRRSPPRLSLTLASIKLTPMPVFDDIADSPLHVRGDLPQAIAALDRLRQELGLAYLNLPWSLDGERLAAAWSAQAALRD
jgi:alkanesulfonate monooxygenase SsuD/methylene tetrahydromethanopterin reductase-like flavin-dependent oxidoreductase (luciferase family)